MAPKLGRRFLLELTRRGDELTHEISLNTVIRYWRRRYPILPFELALTVAWLAWRAG